LVVVRMHQCAAWAAGALLLLGVTVLQVIFLL
jgi:hypothetical protein